MALPVRRVWNIARQYLEGRTMARQPPIFVVGLPRSGTTWLATTLSRAPHTRYYHEPFNSVHIPEAQPYSTHYVTAANDAPDFAAFCRRAFAGNGHYVKTEANGRASRYAWWPARMVIKDVHACLALDWIQAHLKPRIVMIVRHPCAVLASRMRLNWDPEGMDLHQLLMQPALMRDHLGPFRDHLQRAEQPLEQVATFWAATTYVMLRQREMHPEWILVQHEALSKEPLAEYRRLYEALDLPWTGQVEAWLQNSTQHASTDPYSLHRNSANEPEKWRRHLTAEQIERVRCCIEPFELPVYRDFVENQ